MKLARLTKQICSLTCVLAIVLGFMPNIYAADLIDYKKSGDLSADKLTQGQITALLDGAPLISPALGEEFDVAPSVTAPYATGKVSQELLQNTANRLSALRTLAGLPPVTLDAELCENAQYGAVLIAASEFSHTPSKPADMDQDFYQKGFEAASSSNIYAGVRLIYTVDGFMDDSDASNIDRLGHRRWQLNPTLGKVGFGCATNPQSSYYYYSTEKVFDKSGPGCNYDFIAWPASGNFPTNHDGATLFDSTIAWSITLNPQQYKTSNLSAQDIHVTLTRDADGKTWSFSKGQSDGFFNIDTGNYAINNCIIFRPKDVGTYSGTYTVRVDGLQNRTGSAVTDFVYQVTFFDADTVDPECRHTQTTDYPATTSTCIVQGHPAYTKCNLCGAIVKGSDTPLPLADHQYGNLVAEEPASCGVSGMAAHYQCTVCNHYFDINKKETTQENLILPALEHDWSNWKTDESNHWKECSLCGQQAEKAAHTWQWVVDQPATEEETGFKHEECSVCAAKRSKNTVIDKLEHIHTGIVHHEAVPATCHAQGTVEYWTCAGSLCAGKYYGDAGCNVELGSIIAPINPSNHDGGIEQKGAVQPTCTDAGHEDDTYCLGCGQKIADGKVLPALGHDFSLLKHDETSHWNVCSRCDETANKQAHSGGEATCSKRAVCSVCAAEYGELDSSRHLHTELRSVVQPTETTEGYTGDLWCVDCNTIIESGKTLPKLSHKLTYHDKIEATCIAEGSVAYWSCSNPECAGKYYADDQGTQILETIVLPVNPDNHVGETELRGAVAASCTQAGYTGDFCCTACDGVITKGSEIAATGHQYGELISEEPASCELTGMKAHYQCVVCKAYFNADKTETTLDNLIIPALGHKWSDWKTDESRHWKECSNCGQQAENATHTWQWIVDKPATEEETGFKHEECSICGFKRSENTVIDKLDHTHIGIEHHAAVPATCHTEGTVEYWTCASDLCTGKYYADENCNVELNTIVAPIDPSNHDGGTEQKGAVQPTCTTAGKENDTYCLSCGEKISDGKVLPALGHDFSILKHDETSHWNVCARCGETDIKQAHTGGQATCSEYAVCSVCKVEYGQLDPSVHLHTELRGVVNATCTQSGYTGDAYCTSCGALVTKGAVQPVVAHQYQNGACIVCGAKDPNAQTLPPSNSENNSSSNTSQTGSNSGNTSSSNTSQTSNSSSSTSSNTSQTDNSTGTTSPTNTSQTSDSSSNNTSSNSPKTGDGNEIVLCVSALALSVIMFVCISVSKYRRKQ